MAGMLSKLPIRQVTGYTDVPTNLMISKLPIR